MSNKYRSEYPHLIKIDSKRTKWTNDKIKRGFELYYERNSRFPTSEEIDKFDYLPTVMTLRRKYGGVVNARRILGLSLTHHNKGKHASDKRLDQLRISKNAEDDMFSFLISKLPEIRIHEEKPILKNPHIVRADFLIFVNENSKIAVDCFTTESMRSLGTHIYIKTKKYKNTKLPIYYVLYSESIPEESITLLLKNKTILLPQHIRVNTEKVFKENFKDIIKKGGVQKNLLLI